ncbi:MAG: DUF1003 domain-containing protein [Armatimonadota bacterium]|nr:DUF1003 domain-containing protein [Armatimonadota bacterium]
MMNGSLNGADGNDGSWREHHDPILQSVETIADLHERTERRVDRHQRAVETASSWLGRPAVIHATITLIVLWITANLLMIRYNLTPFDAPPFYWLQTIGSLCALLMTMVVVTTQNRLAKITERRSQLDLQIGLLSEQKVTKLISLIEELRRDLPSVRDRHDPIAEAMQEPVDAGAVLIALEASLEDTLKDVELLEAREDAIIEAGGRD